LFDDPHALSHPGTRRGLPEYLYTRQVPKKKLVD
jgi:hypothetical protein